ncbi:MAG: hypothetical protein Ct9H300mP4_16970 [Gammaproteobacteria bacterium]|nr:MAG: hypothetical protein Ct9H300mP4_16970 [Gammaproteobacteria bacterium]
MVGSVYAQEDAADKASSEVEEITVTGSQIKGAKITGSYQFQSSNLKTLKL